MSVHDRVLDHDPSMHRLASSQAIAPKYFNTRFLRVFVENVPWLVEKLGIKVLPCVICFIDGVAKER